MSTTIIGRAQVSLTVVVDQTFTSVEGEGVWTCAHVFSLIIAA